MPPPTPARPVLLLWSCLPVVALPGCRQAGLPTTTAEATAAAPPAAVACTVAASELWPRTVRVQGSLWGDEHATIGAKIAGRVKEVRVDLGVAVAEGEILATLDTQDLELEVRQAEAQLQQVRAKLGLKADQSDESLDPRAVPSVLQELAVWNDAKSKLKRAETLISSNVISDEELQERRAEADVAEAKYLAALNAVDEDVALLAVRRTEIGLAQQRLADATIIAPFAGQVEQRFVAPGVYLNVGQPVVALVRVDPLRFRGGVPETQATQVNEGQEVLVSVAGSAEPLVARISRISPSLDTSSRALTIEADVPNPESRLRTGLFAEAEIVVDPQSKTLAVPEDAVFEFAGVQKVWIVQDGQALERQVTTGRRGRGRVEILEGLIEGDTVVADAEQGRPGPVRTVAIEADPARARPQRVPPDSPPRSTTSEE